MMLHANQWMLLATILHRQTWDIIKVIITCYSVNVAGGHFVKTDLQHQYGVTCFSAVSSHFQQPLEFIMGCILVPVLFCFAVDCSLSRCCNNLEILVSKVIGWCRLIYRTIYPLVVNTRGSKRRPTKTVCTVMGENYRMLNLFFLCVWSRLRARSLRSRTDSHILDVTWTFQATWLLTFSGALALHSL